VLIPPPPRGRSRQLGIGLGVLMLLVFAGAAFFAHRHSSATSEAKTQPLPLGQQSIAVLPFDNFSGEPDTDYLSDGFTEEITTALTRIPNLRVAARNSAFSFKAKKEDARKIAEALRVKTLLEGSLRKAGNKIRVTADLINAADGFHLWSETYDGTLEDLFTVQKDIAQRIAFRLQGQSNSIFPSATRVNPEAHELYLRGRAFWNKRTEPDLRRAIDFFHSAAAKDPAYADAHLGLAVGYYVLQLNSINVQPAELRPLARAEANRALELDPRSAEAETVLGWLKNYARDYKGAEEHFRRALELAPNDATVRQWYGLYFMYNSRLADAWPELEAAADLDPLSPIIQLCPASWYFYHGDLDEAIRRARLVLESFPGFLMAYEVMAETQIAKGNFEEALAEIERGRSQTPGDPVFMLELKAYALSRSGREAEAREILARFLQLKAEGKRVDWSLVFVYLGLREYDHAIQMAESVEATEGLQPGLLDNPLGRELLRQPGFQALLKRAGLKN
jgi:adenylate cyclase